MFNESSNFAENHERGVDNDTASVCEMNQISVDSDRDSVDGDKDGAENDNDSITAGSPAAGRPDALQSFRHTHSELKAMKLNAHTLSIVHWTCDLVKHAAQATAVHDHQPRA